MGYYKQDEKRYVTIPFSEPLEIGSALANVSLKDGKPFVHMHLTAARESGETVRGHLMEGTRVFLIDAYFRAVGGPVPKQEDDLGLAVWR